MDSWWTNQVLLQESTRSPSGVLQESVRSPSGVHQESIRTPVGVYQNFTEVYQES
jgi:hypothetical protein